LKTNIKNIGNGGKSITKDEQEKRNSQFEYINETRDRFNRKNNLVLSVDTKKKEMIGNFKNPGTSYKRQADLTKDHDFLTYAKKKRLYMVYTIKKRTRGFVSIGMFLKEGKNISSAYTPEFEASLSLRWGNFVIYPVLNMLMVLLETLLAD
jgi:hypothetical protein